MKLLLLLSLLADPGTAVAPPDVELLDFTASYCQPCRQMLPIIQRMEQDRFPIRRVDISDEPDLSAKFRITGVPTLVVMVEGREVQRFVGLTSESVLRDAMLKAARDLQEKRGTVVPPKDSPTAPLVADTPESSPATETPPPRRSLADVFQRVFRSGQKSPGVIRGQSPTEEQSPSGLDLAATATVRVQVEGRSTEAGRSVREVGTGTIIHSVPSETFVLTCAHFFLNLQKSGSTVTVEVFENGRPQAFEATVVGGSHTLDLALIRIVPQRVLPAVSVALAAPEVSPGQSLVSFGCDAGRPPGRLDTELVAVNRYLGADNLVCSKDPASGRSGGGLYTSSGTLVGVCSCADREKSQGLYMAWKSVRTLLQELKLESLLKGMGEDSQSPAIEDPALTESDHSSAESVLPQPADDELATTDSTADSTTDPELEFDPLATTPDSSGEIEPAAAGETTMAEESVKEPGPAGPEVTIIIDEKTPGSQKKVIVIPRATPWLMEMLTGEGLADESPTSQRRTAAPRGAASAPPTSKTQKVARAAYSSEQ
ncbi:MAG: trypsin-like peptidase domain-containing protein [Planctomycetaceae bacterium]